MIWELQKENSHLAVQGLRKNQVYFLKEKENHDVPDQSGGGCRVYPGNWMQGGNTLIFSKRHVAYWHVFARWEETEEPGGNPLRHRENVHHATGRRSHPNFSSSSCGILISC